MGLFKKKDKKQDKDESTKKYIVDKIASGINPENAVIAYILLQSKENNISLAYKDGMTYVCFRNQKIMDFLKNWYSLLRLYQTKRIDGKVYNIFVTSQLDENLPPPPAKNEQSHSKNKDEVSIENLQNSKDIFDDFDDIFNDENKN